MKRSTGIIIAIIAVIAIYGMVTYNGLVSKEVNVEKTWANVQSAYQRRLDLTPSLVNTVKGLSDFEQATLVNIAEARSKALQSGNGELTAENYQHQSRLQDTLAAASNRMIIAIEKYPVLKGTSAYRALQTQLEGNERRIKVARNDFNDAIASYNKTVRSFPTSMIAGLFGFKPKEGFLADINTDKAVEIKF